MPIQELLRGETGAEKTETPTRKGESDPIALVLETIRSSIGAELVLLIDIDPRSREAEVAELAGVPPAHYAEFAGMWKFSPVSDVALRREVIYEGMVSKDHSMMGKHKWLVRSFLYESCLGVPVSFTSERAYALFAMHRDPERFTENDLALFRTAAPHAASILAMMRMRRAWEKEGPFVVLGQAYGSMAHDLIDDIAGLRSRIDELCEAVPSAPGLLAAELEPQLARCRLLVNRASSTLRNFTELARDRSTGARPVRISDVASRVVEYLTHSSAWGGYDVLIKAKAGYDPCTPMRGSDLERILYNLLLNSIQQVEGMKALREPRPIAVEIARAVELDRNMVTLRVMDAGPGIHYRDFERVFEVGYSTREHGFGMGLHICRSLAKRAAGSVRIASSTLLAGTIVEVVLPEAACDEYQ